ncbi:MAG: hypothetical protein ABSG43_12320 [Solirubrobacteraceae bacterium]
MNATRSTGRAPVTAPAAATVRAVVTDPTLEAPPLVEPAAPERQARSEQSFVLRWGWLIAGCGLVVLSTILLLWARTRPGYDPYGWLVWGYQTLHLSLDLGGAPSWKPLPYLFTVPYALAGHRDELRLWMITAVTVSLAGSMFAGRIAYRITDESMPRDAHGPVRRFAPAAAALFAGASVLGLQDYMHYILSVQSDPIIVTACLASIDMCLCGRPRWAFVFAVLGSLGRPEVWPFLGMYSIWAWFKVPSMRWMLYGGIALVGFMWFGIPWITNGRPDIAGELALRSPRALHQNKLTGTIGRFAGLQYPAVWVAALVCVAIAIQRRDRLVLALAGAVAAWVAIEIAFAFHGFPALPRYMFEAGAVGAVLAGVGVGWVLTELPKLRPRLPHWSGIPVVVVLVATVVPGAVARTSAERQDLRHERGRTNEIGLLQTTINALGGYGAIRRCGEPVTVVGYASALAWDTRLDVGSVGYLPGVEMRRKYPIVLLLPVSPGGWSVRPWHTLRTQRRQCSRLDASYVLTKQHPSGALRRHG